MGFIRGKSRVQTPDGSRGVVVDIVGEQISVLIPDKEGGQRVETFSAQELKPVRLNDKDLQALASDEFLRTLKKHIKPYEEASAQKIARGKKRD